MILGVSVNGFKSLANFNLVKDGLSNFTCLVGLNGAGKSSVLQLLDFSSHLMRGDVDSWLSKRGWSASDLHSKFSTGSNIIIAITVQIKSGDILSWVGSFNRSTLSCTTERVFNVDDNLFQLLRGKYSILDAPPSKVEFNYTGSILSVLKDEALHPDIVEVKDIISNIKSLELLSPHLMRYSLREVATDIGTGGEKLSPFLYNIKGKEREKLTNLLREFYPSVIDFKVKQERAGWKKLSIIESFNGEIVETDAKHVNDGLLRILAILAQAGSGNSTLLFDEVENGVNPEIVERLVHVLQNAGQQVIVTTHSPMILNYLSDEVAKESVHFIYRTVSGGTRSRPLFSIPKMAKKLEIMGPGEAFVDTSLSDLTIECAKLDSDDTSKSMKGAL
ncbi:chromosome segregation protein SMC [Pseudomonas sp. Choline-02u-1]|jgi:predicted ATP-dependent endonuclease of OLD family|uniref:AAA family ATPase n=1 Tax=Pseudomonas sp. Choline-02u-1 TaxID=2058307 RepID=UPI000C343EEE|nr:ATP-binding protein [Pseudomonas sp. Choline-02u-1]PKH83586.1 chromosome segregation protein SMC [Pseudomonas sp. Choline-02u-1]